MGFWSKLLGKKDAKLDVLAVDADGDGKVQDGTIWERPAVMAVDLDKTIEKVDKLLKEVAPSQSLKLSEDLEKAAKAQARAKKAAMTRAVNKAKKEAELAAQILEASKNSDPKKK